MIDKTWNTLGAPDVLPFGYGGTTGGGYGSLRMQDAPDYVTNRAPFRGPGGTSPMDRGGPNMPAYAPPIQETAGGVIPATTAWPGVTNANAQQPNTPYAVQYQWAGFGYNDARPQSGMSGFLDRFKRTDEEKAAAQEKRANRKATKYRDVQGKMGYVYRQYANEDIEILAGPWGAGKVITATGPHAKYWQAAVADIGTYRMSAGASNALAQAANALTQLAQQVPLLTAGGAQPTMEQSAPYVDPNKSQIPWGVVLGGVALTAGIVLLARRS